MRLRPSARESKPSVNAHSSNRPPVFLNSFFGSQPENDCEKFVTSGSFSVVAGCFPLSCARTWRQ